MKIVNECRFETKLIKDLDIGEVFMYGAYAYMKIDDSYCKTVGYSALRLADGIIIRITNGNASVKLLDTELHIKYKTIKD